MTPSRPYLIRAMYQWMVDNGMTPHMLVNAASEQVQVPRNHVKDGKIVLNLAPMAVRTLVLGNEEVSFSARFDGQPMTVLVPVEHVLAIYTRENGQGMMFTEEDNHPPVGSEDKPPTRPRLKVVK
ncbi:MAG: ClpXP protease specificity-enhancing factor [Gammaproteobacteria bacterium]|nr:ClpXP protease specificity-enhancing factor [Gammaproteobacteria bacterium]